MSRIKKIIDKGTARHSIFEENTVDCLFTAKQLWEHKSDFAARGLKNNLGVKEAMPKYEVPEYTDEEILKLPAR